MSLDEAIRAAVHEEVHPLLLELVALREQLASARSANEFLSTKEAAALVHANPATIRGWLSGGLRSYGQGRLVRIRRDELLAFMANRGKDNAARSVEEEAVILLRGHRGHGA
jgi:excisionase family DNA binding protein